MMRKQTLNRVAQNVANDLIPAEAAIDEALASVARLIGTTVGARLEANLPAACASEAITKMGLVAQLISQARKEMVEVHHELAVTRDETPGLRQVSFGDLMGCPPISATADNIVPIAA